MTTHVLYEGSTFQEDRAVDCVSRRARKILERYCRDRRAEAQHKIACLE